MAGGKGTRLKTVIKDIPKPMAGIQGKPVLEYQVESLKNSNITEITIIAGYLGNAIKEYFGNGDKWGVNISYIFEKEPLGTAGALFYLKDKIQDNFFLLFGDLLLDVDWNRFMDFHKSKNSWLTLYCHPNSHPFDSDIVLTSNNGLVTGIDSTNNKRNYYYHNFVNAGIYCVYQEILNKFIKPEKMDFEKDIIGKAIPFGKVFAYKSTEYVKDMGTPSRLEAATADVRAGVVSGRSLINKQKCVFLDRDGTINVLNGFINSVEKFELLPNAAEAIKLLNESSYLVIVATNQPVIARGECSIDMLSQIHMKMETKLGEAGAYLDDIYYCPHHPHKGYKGEIPALKIECTCRKPKTGMIIEAAMRYNIDLSLSWYIGDTTTDIQTGINAGMQTILLKTGEAGQDAKYKVNPGYIEEDLLQAAKMILRKEEKPGGLY